MNDEMEGLSGRVGEIVAALLCDGTPESCGKVKKCLYHSKDYNNIGTGYGCDVDRLNADAAGLLKVYAARLAAVTAERDAAVKDLCLVGDCDTCYMRGQRGYSRCSPAVCDENRTCVGYKWRGPQEAGEADHAD